MTTKRDKEFYRRIGAKGGRATVEKYGREHMRKIGRRGYAVTTCRYFMGNAHLHNKWLVKAGLHVYWKSSGLAMKRGPDGTPIWPEEMPAHPAWEVAPGQMSLFEKRKIEIWEDLPW